MGCIIELTSITYAIKARDLLRKNKIRARVEKVGGKQAKGCAYAVAVEENCRQAIDLLETAGIKILGIT